MLTTGLPYYVVLIMLFLERTFLTKIGDVLDLFTLKNKGYRKDTKRKESNLACIILIRF